MPACRPEGKHARESDTTQEANEAHPSDTDGPEEIEPAHKQECRNCQRFERKLIACIGKVLSLIPGASSKRPIGCSLAACDPRFERNLGQHTDVFRFAAPIEHSCGCVKSRWRPRAQEWQVNESGKGRMLASGSPSGGGLNLFHPAAED
jgi:hypothetical protein